MNSYIIAFVIFNNRRTKWIITREIDNFCKSTLSKSFNKIASEKKSKIFFSDKKNNYTTDLSGDFQIENVSTVEKTFQVLNEEKILNISPIEISKGLNRVIKNTGLRGRFEITSLKGPRIEKVKVTLPQKTSKVEI